MKKIRNTSMHTTSVQLLDLTNGVSSVSAVALPSCKIDKIVLISMWFIKMTLWIFRKAAIY